MEPFVVKHYSEDERPTIKGNGFDGLEIGQDREEADAFIAFVNAAAPELLEAAIELKDVCNRPSAARTRAEAWRKLDKAIAKALQPNAEVSGLSDGPPGYRAGTNEGEK